MIHLYHGDGKGKTTAAIGLAIRAAGSGYKIYFCQFMKGGASGELDILSGIDNVTILRCRKEYPFYNQLSEAEKKEMTAEHDGIIKNILMHMTQDKRDSVGQKYMIILDEITYPMMWGLIDEKQLADIWTLSDIDTEIVCTGRNPQNQLVERADYVTEMKCENHPFDKGLAARCGIEV